MMLKHVVFLLFLYGIKNGSTGSSEPQEQMVESKDTFKNGIKKNEVGANGVEADWDKITRNFQNPVVEYLLKKNSDKANDPPQKGLIREIRHSQTLLLPSFFRNPLPEFLIDQLPQFESQKKPAEQTTRDPDNSPFDDFLNFLKNKTQSEGGKIQESVVSSPVLHLNKNAEEVKGEESTRIQFYPAVAAVINTFNKDGSLKASVTHFQPDFNSLRPEASQKEAVRTGEGKNPDKNNKSQYTVSNFVKGSHNSLPGGNGRPQEFRQGISWPFANYFPIVINDPFLSVYNAFATSMYNAVSTMVEYGPEADICRGKSDLESENANRDVNFNQRKSESEKKRVFQFVDRYEKETDSDIFDEVTMKTDNIRKSPSTSQKQKLGTDDSGNRKRRDATSIFVKSREGDRVDITLEEPVGSKTNQKIEKTDLILRKGGIAIAGPGGAATAYTGGTAIVGPYGIVYKSPEGTAILGPFSKVVNISDDTSFEEILKMHKEMQAQKQPPTVKNPQGGTAFTNYRNYFSYKTNLPIKFELKPQARSFMKTRPKVVKLKEDGIIQAIEQIKEAEFRRIVQDAPYEKRMPKNNETTLIFRPKSKAEAGRNGVALSAPTSHAILYPGQRTNIYFEPESVASAGPSGFAHAQSDLFVSYVPRNTTLADPQRRRRSMKKNSRTSLT